ncbi:Iron-sulfur cluster-binding protein [Chondromyces apiculatus DSM 436]|uniref:Iron-sulfur cluster-binding protein n=1 Tax=Chondromyces apiculatus DSM 436 TaxID=1192034 RepID=A0A017T6L5_9BACT|nr:Iron-sulfur cluster-binding protein [Chondromyces apiculatus DSM 436]
MPDAITHASTSPEPGPSILAEARVDGAALRTRHVDRLKHDVSAVTLLQGGSPHDLGKRICEAAVPRRSPSTPVLLKPNLCGFDSIKDPRKTGGDDGVRGRTTDPEFTRGVIHCLKERGHQTITVAEGCGHSHKHWLELMDLNGYAAMTRAEGVRLVAMDDDGVFDTQGDRPGQPLAITGIAGTRVPTLLLPRILAEHLDRGLFISLPKLKTHRYSVISVGIKNMQGTVMLSDGSPAYKQKWRMHRELNAYIKQRKAKEPEDRKLYVDSLRVFAERMVDVLEISAPDVVLAEGAPAMGGDGFQVLQPSAEHVAIGGTNPVLVDRIAAEFLGLWNHPRLAAELLGHRTSPLIESAARRFQLDLRAPAVTGDGADLLKQPRPAHFKAMAPFAIHQAAPATAPATAPAPVTSASVPELPSTPLPAPAPPAPPAPASPAPSSTAAGATGAAPPGKPTAHAAPLGSDTLTLDGRGDEPAWARAAVAAWDTDFTGSATGIRTTARFLWSPDALHVLFELSRSGLFTDRAQPVDAERQKLYTEDCVEIFLTPDPASPRRYVEVEIGPFGHFLDLSVDLDARKYVTTWSSGLRRATTQRPAAHQATIEASLTAPEITRALRAGARLPMGLFRMEGRSPRHYLAWSPPRGSKPNFHVPAAFGALVLDPPVP